MNKEQIILERYGNNKGKQKDGGWFSNRGLMPPDGRQDRYPESHFGSGDYRDSGCNLSPSCLSCHLPACKYDVPNQRSAEVEERNAKIRRSRKRVPVIAVEYNISTRTVHRIRSGVPRVR